MFRLDTKDVTKKIMAYIIIFAMFVSIIPVISVPVSGADAFETDISGFPESYKPYLRELHAKYPNWTFKPYNTGIDFSVAVSNEASDDRSLVENSYNDYLKSNAWGDYNVTTGRYIAKDGSSWVTASKNTIAYFMDPRNFLNESNITMFEQLSYDASVHTQEGVEEIFNGSFMYKKNISYLTSGGEYKTLTGAGGLYSAKFIEAAKSSNVSPYYLASKSLQEVGKAANTKYAGMGASGSVNGTYAGYKGIYNFYNIGASDGANAVANGLKWANTGNTYSRPWTSPDKSIIGGAKYIGEKYINCRQDTSYFQRFNIRKDSSYSLYTHQYMTNIYGCVSESSLTSAAYQNLGIMGKAKTFVIPVYQNMPEKTTTVSAGNTTKTGTVNSIVNMRKGPNTSNDIVVTLSTGDSVTILEGIMTDVLFSVKWLNNPYWYKIQVSKNGTVYNGYVSANYIDVTPELNIIKGVPQKLGASVSASETVYYETDNPAVATVDSSGNINGVSAGTTTIRVYTQTGRFSVCGVTVTEKGTVLSEKSISLNIGQKKKISATVYPTDAADKTVTWSSGNSAVASVANDGTITAKSVGTTVISAKAAVGGTVGQCTVKVVKPVTGVSLDKKTVKVSVGGTVKLNAEVKPKDATDKSVTWKTSDKKIAKVKKGVVTGVSAGKATITVKTQNGGKTATCTVTVKPASTNITKVTSKGYNQLKITWNAVAGSTGYKIFRKSGSGSYKLLTKVSAGKTSYTDKGLTTGTEYSYKIAAYRTIGTKTYVAVRSAAKSAKPIPSKPKISQVKKKGKKAAVIQWKKVTGAGGYCLYRKSGASGKYTLIKTIKSGSTVSYKNKKLVKGVTYYYKIRAYRSVNRKKVYSKYSKVVAITR